MLIDGRVASRDERRFNMCCRFIKRKYLFLRNFRCSSEKSDSTVPWNYIWESQWTIELQIYRDVETNVDDHRVTQTQSVHVTICFSNSLQSCDLICVLLVITINLSFTFDRRRRKDSASEDIELTHSFSLGTCWWSLSRTLAIQIKASRELTWNKILSKITSWTMKKCRVVNG